VVRKREQNDKDAMLTCVVGDDITIDPNSLHLFVEFIALLPQIATSARRNSTIVDMDIRSNTLLFHSLHELKTNVRS
jgi:hypothetical protein